MSWLGVEEAAAPEHTPLRDLINSLDRLEPEKAHHLARFAYLLGRVALADRHASEDEVRAMEALVVQEAHLTPEQATMVVGLAKTSNLLFGGTADYDVAREFADICNLRGEAGAGALSLPGGVERPGDLAVRGDRDPPHREPAEDPAAGPDQAARAARQVPARPLSRIVTTNGHGSGVPIRHDLATDEKRHPPILWCSADGTRCALADPGQLERNLGRR